MPDLQAYFEKHHLNAEKILYIYRKDKKTVICSEDQTECSMFVPVHEILEFLPEGDFLNINKGIVVRSDQIVNISRDGIYTMSDGKTFQGRKRGLSEHRRLRKEKGLRALPDTKSPEKPMTFLEKCTLLDDMPLAYCVIELVFNEDGRGADFIFRYCNAQMAVVEGVPVEAMLNHSFYEVFPNGDKKWLVAYADVALNGTKRTLHDYSPEIDKYLLIHCYQPEPGFCACVLQTVEK